MASPGEGTIRLESAENFVIFLRNIFGEIELGEYMKCLSRGEFNVL